MTTGSSDTRPFSRLFQIRWAERLGDPANPYLVRWTVIFLGFIFAKIQSALASPRR